jgi:hypothetical protein
MANWLDVSATTPRIQYVAGVAQTVFTVPFIFFDNTDLVVSVDGITKTLGTHYTVSGAKNETGGTVTFLVAPATGAVVLIVRAVPVALTTHVPPSGPLDIPSLNSQFSRLVAMIQQVEQAVTPGALSNAIINNIRDFGAVGNGVANDTTAFVNALAVGGALIVPKGIYLINPITASVPVHIFMHPEAIIKRRIAAASELGLLLFGGGSDGSTLYGGQFDGNRAAVGQNWPNSKPLVTVTNNNCTLRDISFRNCETTTLWIAAGSGHNVDDMRFVDCAVAVNMQFVDNSTLRNCIAKSCSDGGFTGYKLIYDMRALNRCTIENLVVDGATPANNIDPYPQYFSFERVNNSTVRGLIGSGYAGFESRNIGVIVSGCQQSAFSGLHLKNVFFGIDFHGNFNIILDDFTVHGGWVESGLSVGHGLHTLPGGGYQNTGEDTTFDYIANISNRNCIINNGIIEACENGVVCESEGVSFHGVKASANLGSGWIVQNSQIGVVQDAIGISLIDCEGRFNAFNGLTTLSGARVRVIGGNYDNNGWDTALGNNWRSGIYLSESGGLIKDIVIAQPFVGDTQSFTKVKLTSFKPGSTTPGGTPRTANLYDIWLIDADNISVGQMIKIVNAQGGAVDTTGRVVALNANAATIATSSAVSYSETGNLTNLTGTMSAAAGVVTGVGTAFTTELQPAMWIKVGASYYHVVSISSNTSMVVWPADSFGSTTAQVLLVDVQGIPSQQNGVFCSTVTGPVTLRDVSTTGAVNSHVLGSVASLLTNHDIIVEEGSISTLESVRYKAGGVSWGLSGDVGSVTFNAVDSFGGFVTITSAGPLIINGTRVEMNGNIGIGGIAARALHSQVDDASNNAVTYTARLTHTTSGTPGAGIGVGFEFEAETANDTNKVGATIEAVTTDVTGASEDFDLVFKTMAAGAAAAERVRLTSTGRLTTNGVGIGYATGAGGTVTQITSKATGVTLNKATGQITMDAANLAANTTVSFVLTNSAIAAGDTLILNHISGGTPGSYTLNARSAAGSATIDVRNITAGALAEAIVIAFAVIKAVTA